MNNLLSAIQIRLLEESDDLVELTKLLNHSYKKLADEGLRFLASHQDVEITKRRIEKGKCFVAVLNEKIIGTICYRSPSQASGHEWYNQPFVASCGQFAVDTELQKQGIGNKLIEFAEQLAIKDHATEIAIDTAEGADELRKYYEKRGYRFVAFAQWEVTNYRSVILSKKLE
jgi:predicted N-acetyltransferase YhbS